ncbi:MAG: histidine phosphatase family protein [Nocardioidaceae bacterium]
MTRLWLVRHGRPEVVPSVPPDRWELSDRGRSDLVALGAAGVLPSTDWWFCSPEPKAQQTAFVLHAGRIQIVDDLREAVRPADWLDDKEEFVAVVRHSLDVPADPVRPGWEPTRRVQERVVAAVERLSGEVALTEDADVVMVGHGTAWTLLVAALTGAVPDLLAWQSMTMPDVAIVETGPPGAGAAGLLRPFGLGSLS